MYVLKDGEKFEERCGGKANLKVDYFEIHIIIIKEKLRVIYHDVHKLETRMSTR